MLKVFKWVFIFLFSWVNQPSRHPINNILSFLSILSFIHPAIILRIISLFCYTNIQSYRHSSLSHLHYGCMEAPYNHIFIHVSNYSAIRTYTTISLQPSVYPFKSINLSIYSFIHWFIQLDRWMNGWVNRWLVSWMFGQKDDLLARRIGWWMNGLVIGWMDR